MLTQLLYFVLPFAVSLALTLALTPVVRGLNRRLGMIDKPDPRRINTVPVPRGGGVALVAGVTLGYLGVAWLGNAQALGMLNGRLLALSLAVSLLGLLDDKFSLSPRVKLFGQLAIAVLTWWWAGLGFRHLWSFLPAWLDAALTVFWILGAVNAFNLIDGLDGLASGLALIATLGMAGVLVFVGAPDMIFFHCAFAGGLLGFLRYNYNPASVFLGDSGSMYIGFVLAVLPLVSHASNSFLVSVGVPLLAMGVPIFDTSLAILRRSLRHVLNRESPDGAGEVMTADRDHLHHRILRRVGASQRKAAWSLYALALFLVGIGLVGVVLSSRAAGLWLVMFTVVAFVVFKDMARIELFDAGRILLDLARDRRYMVRRQRARLATPFFLCADMAVLACVELVLGQVMGFVGPLRVLAVRIMLGQVSVLVFLVAFRTYRTVWSRAMLSNYVRLFLACAVGAVVHTAAVYYVLNDLEEGLLVPLAACEAVFFGLGLTAVRLVRPAVRDLFYAIDCQRLVGRKDVSRVLVYGCGLRYRSFRRELVRGAASNTRIVVGLLDDDILLRGRYVGGLRVVGTINDAPEAINRYNVDTVVIACEITEDWLKVVRAILAPTGVRVVQFTFIEKEIMK